MSKSLIFNSGGFFFLALLCGLAFIGAGAAGGFAASVGLLGIAAAIAGQSSEGK